MAGGGGDSRYSRVASPGVEARIQEAREREQQRLDSDVNALLRGLLVQYNDRDRVAIEERLTEIESAIDIPFDRILLAGSVAKHTAVDGISDVDALIVLSRSTLRGLNSERVREALRDSIHASLARPGVAEITSGRLAVTVRYDDGMEIQLLPTVKVGKYLAVPTGRDGRWIETDPKAFRRELTRANQSLGGNLVPAIKLMKAALARFPSQKQLSGYHIEALAVDAAKTYEGAQTPRALLVGLLQHATQRVRRPIADKTGQSRTVDAYLGAADSPERRNVSMALDGLRRRLETATSVGEWKAVLDE